MRKRTLLLLGAALLIASPVFAGHDKCDADAQTCLNYLAKKVDTKGWLGIRYERNEEAGGYTITQVFAGSPADQAGFEVGDVVLAMNGISMAQESEELKATYKAMKPGYTVKYKVLRNGKEKKLRAELSKMPEEVALQMVGEHMLTHAESGEAQAEEE